MLALSTYRCATGENAYFCRGYNPAAIPDIRNPPSGPQTPRKSDKLLQFEIAVDKFVPRY